MRDDLIALGYLIVRPMQRDSFFSAELVPELIVSASTCLCRQFPGDYAVDWCSVTDVERAQKLADFGIDPDQQPAARKWATENFDDLFGWPGTFYSLGAAIEARTTLIPPATDVRVLGLGVHETELDDFLRYAAPPPPTEGYAPQGETGSFTMAKRRRCGTRRPVELRIEFCAPQGWATLLVWPGAATPHHDACHCRRKSRRRRASLLPSLPCVDRGAGVVDEAQGPRLCRPSVERQLAHGVEQARGPAEPVDQLHWRSGDDGQFQRSLHRPEQVPDFCRFADVTFGLAHVRSSVRKALAGSLNGHEADASAMKTRSRWAIPPPTVRLASSAETTGRRSTSRMTSPACSPARAPGLPGATSAIATPLVPGGSPNEPARGGVSAAL